MQHLLHDRPKVGVIANNFQLVGEGFKRDSGFLGEYHQLSYAYAMRVDFTWYERGIVFKGFARYFEQPYEYFGA